MNGRMLLVGAAIAVIGWSAFRLFSPPPSPYAIDPQTYYPTWGEMLLKAAIDQADQPGQITVLLAEQNPDFPNPSFDQIVKGIQDAVNSDPEYTLSAHTLDGVRLVGGVDPPGLDVHTQDRYHELTQDAVAVISLAGPPSFSRNDVPLVILGLESEPVERLLESGRIDAAVSSHYIPQGEMDPKKGQEQLFRVRTL